MSGYKRLHNDSSEEDRKALLELRRTQEELARAAREFEKKAAEERQRQAKEKQLEKDLQAWQNESRR